MFAILDVEWEQELVKQVWNFQIVQIGAVILDEQLHTVKKFWKTVAESEDRGERFHDSMHLAYEDFEEAKGFAATWREFTKWLPEACVFVIWSSEIPVILEQNCGKYHLRNPVVKVVYAQQLFHSMMQIPEYRAMSFEKACRLLSVTCDPARLHRSDYDAACLTRFFRKLMKEGEKYDGEVDAFKRKDGYFHREGCPLAGKEELKENFAEAVGEGGLPCPCCGPYFAKGRRDKTLEFLQPELQKIEKFCHNNQYGLRAETALICIEARNAMWYFSLIDTKGRLYYSSRRHTGQCRLYSTYAPGSRSGNIQDRFPDIEKKEKRLAAGVGNQKIAGLLGRIREELS